MPFLHKKFLLKKPPYDSLLALYFVIFGLKLVIMVDKTYEDNAIQSNSPASLIIYNLIFSNKLTIFIHQLLQKFIKYS